MNTRTTGSETPIGPQSRREVLAGAGALGFAAILASLAPRFALAGSTPETGVPFDAGAILAKAEELAGSEFVRPVAEVEGPFDQLSAEQYRDIRFRPEETLWRGEKLDHELQLLALGWIYTTPVEIFVVEGGRARALIAGGKFDFGAAMDKVPDAAPFGFSGFRLLGPLNRADQLEDYAVFQGASYFRAIGRNEAFGLSARGLALNTAQPAGEEFPLFRSFWIEKPRPGAGPIVVHALLDCPSVTGAYRFAILPGESTAIDVGATLFARRKLTHVGLAPLTSMYLHGPASRRRRGDVRPAVHNSEGLAVLNGKGEHLWRPLINPKMLQTSAFVDSDPKGFGLAQRDRAFPAFDDLEARFERRPTVWVEPKGPWGAGYVELVEIPAEEQIHDNIVAYWKPAKGLEPGVPHAFAYRLTWGEDVPAPWTGARVHKTRVGTAKNEKDGELQMFVVDFEGSALKELRELPRAELAASAGTISLLAVARHSHIDGVRVSFALDAADAETIELRLGLRSGEQMISESWLFRWTKS